MTKPLPLLIRLWFAADALLALLPPLHWAAGGAGSSVGAPRVLLYLFGSSVFVATSVVVAYFVDVGRR